MLLPRKLFMQLQWKLLIVVDYLYWMKRWSLFLPC